MGNQMMTEQAAVSGQIDLNDIRAALGSLLHSHRDLSQRLESAVDKLDDIGAVMHRVATFSALVEDVEAAVAELPAILRKVADDPMIGMFAAGPVNELADAFEQTVAARRAARASAPAIEG